MVDQYAISFHILAPELNWNQEALIAIFWQGMADWVKDELAAHELPETLDALVSLCNRIDISGMLTGESS